MCAARQPYLHVAFLSATPLLPNTTESHVFVVPLQEQQLKEHRNGAILSPPKAFSRMGTRPAEV